MRWLALALCLLAGCHLLIAHDPPRDGAPAERRPAVDRQARERSLVDGGCAQGKTLCAGLCVDLMTDPGHCGTCAVSCPSSECAPGSCEKGTCVSAPMVGPCQGGAGQCVKGSCCTTCVKDGLCVPAADSLTACGNKGGACTDCTLSADPCKTSTCDATGTCVPGPDVKDGTICPTGKCSKGTCCTSGGCANAGCQVNVDTACGPTCEDCTARMVSSSCQSWRCVSNACVLVNAADGDYCELGPAQGGCSKGHCCTNNACFDAMGTALCVNKDTACGPACVDCTKVGLLCQKGSCG